MNAKLQSLFTRLEQEINTIPPARKKELAVFSQDINESLAKYKIAQLIFVCTHNSRRSTLSEVLFRTIALHLGIKGISTYSGGTEATAFNPRMVAALQRAGWEIDKLDDSENPKYTVKTSNEDTNDPIHFSKKYDHEYNPQKDFIVIMVCDSANEACPFIPGAWKRIPLTYIDPKRADDTAEEAAVYDAKVLEIGAELLHLGKLVQRET